jgi:hypothetical protein
MAALGGALKYESQILFQISHPQGRVRNDSAFALLTDCRNTKKKYLKQKKLDLCEKNYNF